ncbi:MAG: pilus assembly protein [Ilumatobacter sp.]|uniref:TadE family protein n=1 Tax=Ilumatobacter sp. TaxID=1967498 RepID=UPI0026349616|nr:TadE family protein [Ilumatobacter sp.]MDJ0767999.1 pilus assembly protein [Ilumatobacter sp.]
MSDSVTNRDVGSTSLTTVLLTPVFIVIAFAAFQAAMWSHARTEARFIARDTAAQVARGGVPTDAAEAAAEQVLRADTDIGAPDIRIETDPGGTFVTVTVTGRAPGIIRGTSTDLTVVEAVPIEAFRP